MRLAIVVDRLDSGLGISASARAELDSDIRVIAALDFRTPGSLIKELYDGQFYTILFSWRFLLADLLDSKTCTKKMDLLLKNASIGFLIPDHLGEFPKYSIREEFLSRKVDFFLVTSQILAARYATSIISNRFRGIFHDLPNLKAITEVKKMDLPKEKTVIWIGNSNWGNRQNFVDHKGYSRTIIPLSDLISASNCGLNLKIIDSSQNFLQNGEVLIEIAKARFLIIASASEGTGLPILEALGLQTVPISTKVGIAPEVLNDRLKKFLVEPSADQIMDVLEECVDQDFSTELTAEFNSYVHEATLERIPHEKSTSTPDIKQLNSFSMEIRFLLKWFFRYLKKNLLEYFSK